MTQEYTLRSGDTISVINAECLPLREAQEIANQTGQTCVIFHSAGRQYVYSW